MSDTRLQVQSALKALNTKSVKQVATALFGTLGYASRKTVDLDGTPLSFLRFVDPTGGLAGKAAAQTDKWQRVCENELQGIRFFERGKRSGRRGYAVGA